MQSEHKKLMLGIIMGIFFFSFTSAALTGQQNNALDLKIVCVNAGPCSASTECNVSVFAPDETVLLDAVMATSAPSLGYFNITLNETQTTQFGEYRAAGFCKDGSVTNVVDFVFDITADGKPFNTFPHQFSIIFFSFLFVALGLHLERLTLFKYLGSIIMMIMGVMTLYPGYSFINWTNLLGLSLGSALIGLGFYFMIEDSFSRDEQAEYYTARGGENED